MLRRKRCPQCAEGVRQEAKVCRFCGHHFRPESDAGISEAPRTRWAFWSVAVSALIGVSGLAWWVNSGDATSETELTSDDVTNANVAQKEVFEPLNAGQTLEWQANVNSTEIKRQVGPFIVTITRANEGEYSFPVIKMQDDIQTIELKGQPALATLTHRISVLSDRPGALPAIMLQSFSGGAHCCNQIQLAGSWAGKLTVVDLGTFDGDYLEVPKDINGDGFLDFQIYDNSFLYAFASYASSHAPPRFFNIIGGRVVDVSTKPSFKKAYEKIAREAGAACANGSTGDERNGACPAYVAAAARLGRIESAWRIMVESYDSSYSWDLPTGCLQRVETCPETLTITYKSYPEALLAFLKRNNYVKKDWIPPDLYPSDLSPTDDSELPPLT